MKICTECRFYGSVQTCNHPNNGISVVTGEPNVRWAFQVRGHSECCREEGLWFEAAEVGAVEMKKTSQADKPWYKFWSRNA